MDKMIFTKEAMREILKIMISCKMILRTPFLPNQHYLVRCVAVGKDCSWGQFHEGIPNKEGDRLFNRLIQFAREIGSGTLTSETVWRFFASAAHYQEKIEEFETELHSGNVPESLRARFLVAHLLLPVNIISAGETLVVRYSNSPAEVRMSGIRMLGKNRPALSLGQTVLVHFGSVIAESVPEELEHELLLEQRQNANFIASCGKAKEIDFEKFFV